MNAKIGGSIWKVEMPKSIPLKTMIIGIDSHRNLSLNKDSCFALVASINQDFS